MDRMIDMVVVRQLTRILYKKPIVKIIVAIPSRKEIRRMEMLCIDRDRSKRLKKLLVFHQFRFLSKREDASFTSEPGR